MKSFFKHFWKGALVLALFSGALWSCEEIDNPDGPDNPANKVTFTLTPPEVTIPADGGSATVTFDAPVAWKAESKDNWVSADPSKGDAGKVTVTLKANANETGESRSTDVTVSATEYKVSATVKVTQAAKENVTPPAPEAEISLDVTKKEFTADGGTFTVNVTANTAWKAAADCDWLAIRPAEGTEGKTAVTVVANPNNEEKQKSGHVTFTAGEKTADLEVIVAAYVPETPKAKAAITIVYPSTWPGVKLYLEAADGEKPCGEMYGKDPDQVSPDTYDMFGITWKAAAFIIEGNFTQPKEYKMIVSDSSTLTAPEYKLTLENDGEYGFFVTPDAVVDVNDVDPGTDPGNKPAAYINVNYPAEWTGIRLYLEGADGEKPCGDMPGAEPLGVSEAWEGTETSWRTASFRVTGEFSEGKVYKMLVFDMGAGLFAPEYQITLKPEAKFNFFVTHDDIYCPQSGNKATIMVVYPSNWTTAKLYLEATDGEKPCGNMPGMDPTMADDEVIEYAGGTWKFAIFEFYGEFYTDEGGKEYAMTVSDGAGNSAPAYKLTLRPNCTFLFIVTAEKVEIFNEDIEDPEDPDEPDPDMPGDVDEEGGVVLFEGEYSESETSDTVYGKYLTARASAGDIIRIKYTLNNWERYTFTEEMAQQLAGTGLEDILNIGDPFGYFWFQVGRGENPTGKVACSAPMVRDYSDGYYGYGVAGSGTIAIKLSARDINAMRYWDMSDTPWENSFCIIGLNVTVTKVVLFHKE